VGEGLLPWVAGGFTDGTRVAGYRLVEQIGHGGMAVVFRAHDERLNRQVALKIMAPALASDIAFRRRFIRESQVAATVDDPNIIPVYDAGEAEGVLFIAMRLVRGGDVKSLVTLEGPLPITRVEWITSAVASALDAAHAQGLVHRDVKPHNMLLEVRPGRPDHVYLSDFGLSKMSVASSGLTGSGQFLGTVDYCSPEQIQGKPVDGRTDQYALGCTAFELLTGEAPFARDHAMAVMWAHVSEDPPAVTARCAGLSPAADDVFAKVLAKDPADRYPNCQEFADSLGQALGVQPYVTGAIAKVQPGAEVATGLAASAPAPAPASSAVAVSTSKGATKPGQDATSPGTHQPPGLGVYVTDQIAASTAYPSDPSHPSHPSHPSDQTTNLRTIRELVDGPPKTSEPPEVQGPVTDSGEVDLPSKAKHPGHRIRVILIAATAALAVAGGAVGLFRPSAPRPKPTPKAAKTVSRTFPPQQVRSGVLAVRHWKLGGSAGSVMSERVTLSNTTDQSQRVTFMEPVPTAIAPSLATVHFTPAVAGYTDAGRVAVWVLKIPAHRKIDVGYQVRVPAVGTSGTRLTAWANDLRALSVSLAKKPAKVRLRSLSITPTRLKLAVGSTARLTASGELPDKKKAPANDLAAVVWKSANPRIATVNMFGKVSANSIGTARVMASIGTLVASIQVTVTHAQSPNPNSSSNPAPTYSAPSSGHYTPPTHSSTAYTPPVHSSPPHTTPPVTSSSPNPTPTVTPSPLMLQEFLLAAVSRPPARDRVVSDMAASMPAKLDCVGSPSCERA